MTDVGVDSAAGFIDPSFIRMDSALEGTVLALALARVLNEKSVGAEGYASFMNERTDPAPARREP